MRYILRLCGAPLLALIALVLAATPALAHTGFESSDPVDGATVTELVQTITLVFTGPAEPTGSGFQVLDAEGQLRVPTDAASADGTTWVLRFDPALGGGTVGVRWMVKAPDAHPIEGSFSFTSSAVARAASGSAGGRAANAPTARSPSLEGADAVGGDLDAFLDTSGDPTALARRVGAGARTVTLIGTLVGVGALVFAAAVLRGHHRDVTHVLHWVRRAGVVVVAGASAELLAQIGVEGGGDWAALWSPSTIATVVASSFGAAVALRITGGLALTAGARLDIAPAEHAPDPVVAIRELVSVGAGPGTSPNAATSEDRHARSHAAEEPYVHHGDHAWLPTVDSAGAIAGAAAVVIAYLFDGHTVSKGERLWTSIADLVHVTGGAIWAGGVLMLVAILWRRHRQGRDLRALQLAVRFSVVATIALVAVGIAGIALTVIVLDSPSELWTTEWGRTLGAKVAFVGVAACADGYNHKVLIPAMHRSHHDPVLAHHFRRVVTAEAVALVGVLAITALLIGAAS